jgi:hypothetical protein
MVEIDKIEKFFEETGLSKESLLESVSDANWECQSMILRIFDFCNNENWSEIKKIHSMFLEIKLREFLSERYPLVFNPLSNHNTDPDITNIQDLHFSLELKSAFSKSGWTFGQASKQQQKLYCPYHILVRMKFLDAEEMEEYDNEAKFMPEYISFAYIPKHPHKNFTLKQSKEYSIELFSL